MKTFGVILKIIAALAAIAGIVYVVATYGDKIVAWAKKMLGYCCDCECETCDCGCDDDCDDCQCQYDCDTQCPCECQAEVQEAEVTEAPAEQGVVEAEEKDFEG